MNWENIDWDATVKSANFIIALSALLLSVLNAWHQRNRVRVGISVKHLRTVFDTHYFEVTITNTGNVPFSISQAFLSSERKHLYNDIANVLYESSANSIVLFLQPGNAVFLQGSCSGSVRQVRSISVKINNGRLFSTQFALNETYSQNWVAFLLTVFRQKLPEYEVTYWEGFAHGALCRAYNFYEKGTDIPVGDIRGQVPIAESRSVRAHEVNDLYTEAYIASEDMLLHRLAERFPDIFQIDYDNSEGLSVFRGGGKILYVLQYTEAVCESYASETGGAEYFLKYGFNPHSVIPPKKFP
jgi:hypothetical protein